jgi:leucyl/phenylalanyl-tRNA---protein transferase
MTARGWRELAATCPWGFPDLTDADADDRFPDDLVCLGADLEPSTLVAAYVRGLFPMPGPVRVTRRALTWWSPMARGVLPLDGLQVSRSLAKSCRRMELRVDTAFEQVVRACADPRRDQGWIDEEFIAAYTRLHHEGLAHSVEAWRDGELVGGLYGVGIAGLFAGESMYHHARDASKVALVGLVDMLRDEYADTRLLDVQWATPHLGTLGAVEVPRRRYLTELLPAALRTPAPRLVPGPPRSSRLRH